MIIEIFGDGIDRSDIKDQPRRVSCRGVVVAEGRILVVRQPGLDVTTLPGGGLEAGETLADCVKREIAEETGVIIGTAFERCTVVEYFVDSIWETHYFACEDSGATVPTKPTEEESRLGLEALRMDLFDFLSLLETYESTNPYGANILERELIGVLNTI
jgi:ADP-ribose pyrophosphatase YjhB (NUDIX family)